MNKGEREVEKALAQNKTFLPTKMLAVPLATSCECELRQNSPLQKFIEH